MIAELFIPEHIGKYFVRSRRSVTIMITEFSVRAVIVRAVRSQRFIETLVEEPISQEATTPIFERTVEALQKIVAAIPRSLPIITIVPSSQVIFKIITVPLMGIEKIKLLVPFEVEASLPFPLAAASLDCIILQEDIPQKKARVLVAATTKAIIDEQLRLFAAVERMPVRFTTELIELTGFLMENIKISPHDQPTVALYIDQKITIIIVMHAAQIVGVRTISQGMHTLILHGEVQASVLTSFAHSVVTTSQSFLRSIDLQANAETKLILCGLGSEEPALCEALSSQWDVSCELLTINKLLHDGNIVSNMGLTNAFLVPIVTALPMDMTDDFNLDQETAQAANNKHIIRQIGCGVLLIGLLFITLFLTRFIVLRQFRSEMSTSEAEGMGALRSHIPALKTEKFGSLEKANQRAELVIQKQQEIWFALSSQNRFALSLILQEISKRINREELGLDLRQLIFHEENKLLVLEGSVRDFSALVQLEKKLRESPMFSIVPGQLQSLEFTLEIKLNLGTEGELP